MSGKDEESSSLPFFSAFSFCGIPTLPFLSLLFEQHISIHVAAVGWLAGYLHQLVERLRSTLAKDQWRVFVVGEMKEQEELPSSSRRQFPMYCVTTDRKNWSSMCQAWTERWGQAAAGDQGQDCSLLLRAAMRPQQFLHGNFYQHQWSVKQVTVPICLYLPFTDVKDYHHLFDTQTVTDNQKWAIFWGIF